MEPYSYYSATHDGLSHTALSLGNTVLLQHVCYSAYEPRLLSDHSSFWVWLDVTVSLGQPLWRVNPFWLTLFLSPGDILGALKEFLRFNRHSASAAVVWNSLKALLRGCLIREITGIKRRSEEWEDSVCAELQHRE